MRAEARAGTGARLGRWTLEGVLGEGATARVFAARHVDVARRAAVKVLHADRALDPVARERFAREADAAARVRHPNVVPVLDAGIEDGVAYVVMDLLEGDSLAAILGREGALAPSRAARLGRDLAAGLAAIHARGVIHRDLKPANVVLVPDGEGDHPVLVDFGAAWLTDPASGEALTLRGELLGTPRYMSPEQGAGVALDPRSDLYALGVVLYECLTGRCPYEGPTWQATLLAAARGRCPPIRTLRPEVPAALDRVVRRAMAPDRDARYPNAAALREALEHAWVSPRRSPWGALAAALACGVLGVAAIPQRVRVAPSVVPARPHEPPAAPAPDRVDAPTAQEPGSPSPTPSLPTVEAPRVQPPPRRVVRALRSPRREVTVAVAPEAARAQPVDAPAVEPTRVLGRGAHGAWILAPSSDPEERP